MQYQLHHNPTGLYCSGLPILALMTILGIRLSHYLAMILHKGFDVAYFIPAPFFLQGHLAFNQITIARTNRKPCWRLRVAGPWQVLWRRRYCS